MIRTRYGRVKKILQYKPNLTEILVEVEEKVEKAVNYDSLTGKIWEGAEVLLNTTALNLSLGTGGYHFVMSILGQKDLEIDPPGHIMKLRYTPWQIKTLAVEEEVSPYRRQMEKFTSLEKIPVIIGSLHSMLPLAAAGFYQGSQGQRKLVYIMTDGGALPLAFSHLVRKLQDKGLIAETVTVGNAFGGDLEAVNIYTGLIAAKEVLAAQAVVVVMGPGIVGTGTEYGFTGVEQGEIINSVNVLGGTPIAIPRFSFTDQRRRHQGISHHTLTTLGKIALTSALVPLPKLKGERKRKVWQQLLEAGIMEKHQVIEMDEDLDSIQLLEKLDIRVTTMGRGIEQEREFFQAGVLAGKLAANVAVSLLTPAQ